MDYLANTPDQLAQILRGRRKSKRLTQKTASAKTGLLPKTISAMENTPDGSTLESLFKLLSALELELVLRSKTAERQFPSKLEW
ncbi:MAG: helix-turn-helix domain-containing protein [Proteobacteria bacterium]|nr:MAG: helix-turn-helix domain-containing protein [Pseudomonadota bacterium]